MKATKYIAMAAGALAYTACSNEELASVAPKNKSGLKPLEFSTIVQKQTRAQIEASNLTTLYMTTTGSFYDANNVLVTDPTLTLTKSGSDWTYTYNDNTTPSDLFWPSEGTNATFKAWYYDGGSAAGALNNKSAEYDAVGAYAAINYVEGEQTVSLSTYHAVAKAEFKVKVLEKTQGNNSVKVDVKSVCLHNMNYKASAYTKPTSEAQMGAFTVDGATHRDLITPIGDSYTPSFITEGADAVTKGTMFVLPQTFEVQDLTAATWDKPYISVLAQICIDKDGDSDPIIFPKYAGAEDYAWIALPLPSDFTGMEAHKKYVFTINFRNDALGKVDRDQNPNGENKNGDGEEPDETGDDDDEQPSGPNTNDKVPDGDEGSDVKLGNHSGYPLKVTVTTVDDFGEGGEYDVTNTASAGGGGSLLDPPTGALSGAFSVSATKKVYFSQGNLQWSGTNGWRFAEHQYDYIGAAANNTNPTASNGNYLDLFCWGATGLNGVAPNTTSSYFEGTELTGNNDWGSNAITNGGNSANSGWRTLTIDEWNYLLSYWEEGNRSAAKYGQATVAGAPGLIILPDEFTDPMKNGGSGAFVSGLNNESLSFTNNVYSAENWVAMETAGAVFLPAALRRTENGVRSTIQGNYWSTTLDQESFGTPACCMRFDEGNMQEGQLDRSNGMSVRLVYNAN